MGCFRAVLAELGFAGTFWISFTLINHGQRVGTVVWDAGWCRILTVPWEREFWENPSLEREPRGPTALPERRPLAAPGELHPGVPGPGPGEKPNQIYFCQQNTLYLPSTGSFITKGTRATKFERRALLLRQYSLPLFVFYHKKRVLPSVISTRTCLNQFNSFLTVKVVIMQSIIHCFQISWREVMDLKQNHTEKNFRKNALTKQFQKA